MPNFLDITGNAEYADASDTAAVRDMDLSTADRPLSFPDWRELAAALGDQKKVLYDRSG